MPRGPVHLTLIAIGALSILSACAREATPPEAPLATPQTREHELLERSAAALGELRKDPRFAGVDVVLERARAVVIFPRLVKASLIFGGEGGNGVLVARRADGSWSDPAFYSLGSPSVGLQVGYQEAVVVLFIMDDATLERVLHSSVLLGGTAGVTLGELDELDRTRADVLSANVYQVVDAQGAFAGVSLDGYVIGARRERNRSYYGTAVTPRQILLDGSAPPRPAPALSIALAPRAR